MDTTIKKLKSLLTQVDNTAKQYGMENELSDLNALIEKTEKRQVNLLVCGEYKRGKSSLINAFLNENICPEDKGIATSAISIISYGETPKVIRHYGKVHEVVDNQEQSKIEHQTEEIALCDISKFADGTVADIQNTILLEIKIPNERLKDGLTIIDTPGVGSLDPRHLFLTLYALPKADIIYFITDAEEPLQNTELDFYQSRIASTGKLNRILVNKSDIKRRREVETIIDDIKKKINNSAVEIQPVSAKLWKEYNADNTDSDKLQSSHRDEICAAISKDVANCAIYLSEIIRKQFIAYLNKLMQLIEMRKSEVSNTNDIDQRKSELQQKIAELKQLRDDVVNQDSDLRCKIAKTIKESQKEVLNKLSEESVLLSSNKLEQILKDDRANDEGGEKFVVNELNKAISILSHDLDKEINASIEQTIDMVGKEIALKEEHFDGTIKANISPLQQTFSDKAMSMTRQSLPFMGVTMTTAMVGAAGVGLVGGLLGASTAAITVAAPYIAIPLGIAAGIAFVVKSIRDSRRQANIAHLRTQVSPRLTISMNELRQYIQNRYEEFNELLVHCLKETAEQMTKQMREIFESLKKCEAGEQEKKAEEKKLEAQLVFVKGLITQATVYNKNPFSSSKSHD